MTICPGSFQSPNAMLRLETNVAIIAAAIPALRPLWVKSARQNKKTKRPVYQPEDKRRLKPSYFAMNRPVEADSLASRLETRVTAQGDSNHGGVGSETTPLPNRTGILQTSDTTPKDTPKVEGKWTPERPSLSDRESSVNDMV